MKELARVMKPQGVGSHRIDLKDHLEGKLHNLRFSEALWESNFMARSGFYTNRIRYFQMLALFKEAGFHVALIGTDRWNALPLSRMKLHSHFSECSDDDLLVSGFDVLLRTI